jgi:hypothetical protein
MPRAKAPPELADVALCAALPLAAWAAAWPGAEAGMIDDFSYTHMAKVLAETGRFEYDGWSTTLVGAQAWWAAAWIRLCGFSFAVVRLSVLPLACAACGLVAFLARRSGLPRGDAVFVAALTGLSTPFLQLVPTFMTDLPALCLLLASLACFAIGAERRAAVPRDTRAAIGWLVIGTACGLLGGTIRQSVWLAVPTAAATVALLPGRPPRLRAAAAACGLVGAATLVAGVRWFARQPYALPTVLPAAAELTDAGAVAGPLLEIVAESVRKLLPTALFCLPWIVAECRGLARGRVAPAAAAAVLLAAAVVGGTIAGVFEPTLSWAGGSWKPGGGFLHDTGVGLVRAGVILAIGAVALAVVAAAARAIARGGWRGLLALPPALLLPLLCLGPYVAALVVVSRTSTGIFPRYFLPIIPPLACGILRLARSAAPHLPASAGRRSVAGWLLVAFFAARGLAIVHDDFAETRARLAAIAHLRGRGVPRERIASKWTIDAWEQVERAGFVNDPRIRVPADAWRPDVPADYPDPKFATRFPALDPRWHVTVRPAAADDASPRFPFTVWRRPPYRREAVIVPLPPGSAAPAGTGG